MTARTNTLPIAALRKEQSTIHSIQTVAWMVFVVGKFKGSTAREMSKIYFSPQIFFLGNGHRRGATRREEGV